MSWKTSLFGFLAAFGVALSSGNSHLPNWAGAVGSIITIVGTAGTGLAAKDKDVTGGTRPNTTT